MFDQKIIYILGVLISFFFYSAVVHSVEVKEGNFEPYINTMLGGSFISALTKNENEIFTIKKNLLTFYKLNPLRKVYSKVIDFDLPKSKGKIKAERFRAYMVDDGQSILIYSRKKMVLIDILSGEILKQERVDSALGELNDNDFITVDSQQLSVWNAGNLEKKKKVVPIFNWTVLSGDKKFIPFNSTLTKVGKYLLFYRGEQPHYFGELTVLTSDSYSPLISFKTVEGQSCRVSYDLSNVAIDRVRSITDYRVGEVRTGIQLKDINLSYDLNKKLINKYTDSYYQSYSDFIPLSRSTPVSISRHQSNKFYVLSERLLVYPKEEHGYFRNKLFYQFDNGEAVLMNLKNKKFQATEKAKKYIYMKSGGKVVPIDFSHYETFIVKTLKHTEW